MTDVVVTVPKDRWLDWIDEGDLPGEVWGRGDAGSDGEYHFYLGGPRADIHPGERVYVVAHGKLRGFAPLTRLDGFAFVRKGDACAVTIAAPITGFRGFRYRWWNRDEEAPFPDWRTP